MKITKNPEVAQEIVDKVYAAGVVDCDGSIYIARTARGFNLVVCVSMRHKTIPQWLHQTFGGKIYRYNTKGKNYWSWRLIGKKAQGFLPIVYSSMKEKKQQAPLALSFPVCISGCRLTADDHTQRERICKEMKELNTR